MYDYDVIVVGAGNAAFAAAVSAHENGAKKILVLEKAPKDMRGGNTHWSGGMLRLSYEKPRDLEPLLPGIEDKYKNFYDGLSPYPKSLFHDDLMRVTNGRTDPILSKIFVEASQETVFWMHKSGGVKMEPPINMGGVRQGDIGDLLRHPPQRPVADGPMRRLFMDRRGSPGRSHPNRDPPAGGTGSALELPHGLRSQDQRQRRQSHP